MSKSAYRSPFKDVALLASALIVRAVGTADRWRSFARRLGTIGIFELRVPAGRSLAFLSKRSSLKAIGIF